MGKFVSKHLDIILILGIFLPYIPGGNGLRIEHLLVYFIFLFLLLNGKITGVRIRPYSSILFLYTLILIHTCISSVVNQVELDLRFLANIENYVETFILFLIFNALIFMRGYFNMERMIRINRLFHLLLAANTILILFEIFTPYAEIVIQYYVPEASDELRFDTSSMGRYTGVFDLVFASGFAYSLGLITWVYNFVKTRNHNSLNQVALLVLILIGGLASVSKVFFLGGIPIAVWTFIRLGRIQRKILLTIYGSIAIALLLPYFVKDWQGYNLFEDFWTRFVKGSAIDTLSSGRLGNQDGIYSMVLNRDVNFFFGKGFTMGDLPFFDSEHVQFYYQGGIVAFVAYLLIMLKNFSLWSTLDRGFKNEKVVLLGILILGLMTAFGGPVFFMNRVRIFFFLQVFYLYKLCLVSDKVRVQKRKSWLQNSTRTLPNFR